ncbi:hypothetical protein LCGC14_0807940 [marine sediment metagenome]|uniref:SpoVT-AbrB domain-containing protein n=1 Tax=marine sediment metagenome TaxID=412755 RepID=A0A0F9PMJ8_9ZZZZ
MSIEELKKLNLTGNSFFITLPKKYVYAIGLKLHDLIVVRLTNGKLELIPYERNNQCQKK